MSAQTQVEFRNELLGKLIQAHVMACLRCGLDRMFMPLPEIRDKEPDCKHCKVHIIYQQCFTTVNPFKCRNFGKFWASITQHESEEAKT